VSWGQGDPADAGHILDDVGMKPNAKTKEKAARSSPILCRDLNGEPFEKGLGLQVDCRKAPRARRSHTLSTGVQGSPPTQSSPMQTQSSASVAALLEPRPRA
jgi:hypothetical protein